MTAFLAAFALVFVAEIGDKSQLLVLAFASRYKPRVVVAAIFVATALMFLLSVSAGEILARVLPPFWVQLISGVAFLGFGAWSLRAGEEEESEKNLSPRFGPFLAIATTFLISELGDKTMLAAAAVASQHRAFVAVWLGSTLGMFLADCVALAIGLLLGKRLPARAMRYGAAAIFLITGAVTIAYALVRAQ